MSNVLFICSKNQWRSPTAEMLFKNHPDHQARSAGTSDKARIKVNEKLLAWADVIFVMERRHKQRLNQRFPLILMEKTLIVLDIEDDYRFGDEELIGILKEKLNNYL
ncbi:protein tyrosine phosphatase [uncultured Mucilaginibacter sp.]|uniref:low molecular weight protein tyrosine phosphatase family protein n=1 Tax=uncultured Mucilaginibacter sp. TaxID=797541 RepID=UPI0025E9364E|nr:protein tyrosine phosphatase [uncultured Mucilaginibacter sp.]